MRVRTGYLATVSPTGVPPKTVQLRIAVLAPLAWRVPPRHYGPWELFASLLTEGLVARGHDVTLFASADSVTKAKLRSETKTGWSEDASIDPKVAECLHIASVFEQSKEFDIIHNSFDFLPLTYSRLVDTPVVTTLHGFSSERIVKVYQRYNSIGSYVSISDADRHPLLNYAATIHHGIDTSDFELCDQPSDALLFFGRIHPDKGTAVAIEVARRAGRPLIIAGIVQDADYFRNEVLPHVDGKNVTFLGPIGGTQRREVLANAHAMLHLIDFDEPFGFSVVEAMASGTPIIAFDRGSMRELIDDGITGFVVRDIADAVCAVDKANHLLRPLVRDIAVGRFDSNRMVDQYIDLYLRVLGNVSPALDLGIEREITSQSELVAR